MTIERPSPRAVPRFVLASGSPRRRQLLAEAGYVFEVGSPQVEEVSSGCLTIRELTLCNATRKAWSAAQTLPDAVVLGADTLVTIDDDVLGKPVDLEDAARILRRLSGRSHEVWTAVCLCHLARGKSRSFCAVSRVKFRHLTDRQIKNYFTKVDPLDKAGGYAAQGYGQEIIQRIEGSFSNVVGLPMERTIPALAAFGIIPAATSSR